MRMARMVVSRRADGDASINYAAVATEPMNRRRSYRVEPARAELLRRRDLLWALLHREYGMSPSEISETCTLSAEEPTTKVRWLSIELGAAPRPADPGPRPLEPRRANPARRLLSRPLPGIVDTPTWRTPGVGRVDGPRSGRFFVGGDLPGVGTGPGPGAPRKRGWLMSPIWWSVGGPGVSRQLGVGRGGYGGRRR